MFTVRRLRAPLTDCMFNVRRLSTCSRQQNVACLLCDACPHTRATNCVNVHSATFPHWGHVPCHFIKVVRYSTIAYDLYSHASAILKLHATLPSTCWQSRTQPIVIRMLRMCIHRTEYLLFCKGLNKVWPLIENQCKNYSAQWVVLVWYNWITWQYSLTV